VHAASWDRFTRARVHSHNIDITELRHPGIAAFGFLKLFHDEPDDCFAAVKFAQLLPRSNSPPPIESFENHCTNTNSFAIGAPPGSAFFYQPRYL
jgi:hypothetical protein